ncbi:MAG: cytochrome c oxidase assembly protein [Thermomicrobiales bacterium]
MNSQGQADGIEPVSLLSWQLDIPVMLGIIGAAAIYLWITSENERTRYPDGAAASAGQMACFFGGLAAFGIALLSPIEPVSDDYLLSGHMVQHILLTIVGPPLVLLGIPTWLYRVVAQAVGPVWTVWRFLTKPLLAFVLFNLTFALVHFPSFYNLALQNQNVHILEHVLLWGTSFIGWWPILAPTEDLGALPRPLKGLYLLGSTIPGQVVGALLTFASTVVYHEYERAPRLWGISPLADQQIGGLLMWVLVGTFFLIAALATFGRWAAEQTKADQSRPAQIGTRQKPVP